MRRTLSGRLEHLPSPALLRLVSATSTSGILEIETDDGLLRLEVERGRVRKPSKADLEDAGRILGQHRGEFRFTPAEVVRLEGEVISLSAFAEAAGAAASHVRMELLLGEDLEDVSRSLEEINIHGLPRQPLENPIDELLADLEAEGGGELLFADIGVLAVDPRWWRGTIELDWRRRGWKIRHLSPSDDIDVQGLDLLVVHHQHASVMAGAEERWLQIIGRAAECEPPIPVVWVAPLGDPTWIHRLIEAGVSFLMPAPAGETGETSARFADSLARVVDRQLQLQHREGRSALPSAVTELVGFLLSESDPDQGISSLLHLAAEHFTRSAVLTAEETAIRCRAGFGYRLDRTSTVLPRGIGLIERVVLSGEAVTRIDSDSGGAAQLARLLGISELPAETAIIPLGRCGAVVGVLVADKEGEKLPDVADLVLLVGRLGGVVGVAAHHRLDARP